MITTAVSDQGYKKQVESLVPKARAVIRVNTLPLQLDEGLVAPAKGLPELVEVTMEVIPEGQKNAFAAAKRVSLSQKLNRAHKVVAASATAAGAAAAIPLPFSDAAAIVPIQISMLAGISACFGLEVTSAFLGTMVSSTFTSLAGTMAGRAVVGALLKLIPDGGSIVGGVIAAGVATSLTVACGEAYIATLERLLQDHSDRQLSAEEVAEAFKQKMEK